MENRPAFLHPSRNDEPKACWDSEPKPSGQQRKGNISPGTRTRLGENRGIEVETKEQEERSNSRESAGHVKTLKHTALATNSAAEPLLVSTAASRIPTMHSATTKLVTARTVNTTSLTKIASNQPTKAAATGVEVLSLSSQPQPSGPKLRSPNASHEKKLQASAKTFPKNIKKTVSTSHIMGSADSPQKMLHKTTSATQISSTDSPKSLNRASLSHIPRATSSPKLKLSHPASLKLEKTERNRRVTGKEGPPSTSPKDKMIDTSGESKLQLGAKAAGESPSGCQEQEIKSGPERVGEALADEREDTVLQGRDLTVTSSIGCKQTFLLSSKQAAEQLKEPEDKIDAYVTSQERHTGNSQRKKEKEEAKSEERRQTGEKKRDAEIKMDKMASEVKKDAEKNKTPKSNQLNDAETKTIKGLPVTEKKDVELQADLHPVCVDVEVQAVMEVCSKSTNMSPVHGPQPRQLDPEIDLNPKVGLHNDLNPDSSSDSDWLPNVVLPEPKPMGAKPRFLGPPPYKSPNSQKPLQHVCQIEIELRSQSPQTLDSKVTFSEFDATCELEVLNKTSEDSLKPLNSGRKGEADGEKEESATPQQIIWDEQGMTWEVYGASLDMESLGFAIQNHLQCKIHEQERRIGTLRKSICLSEQSPVKGRTGKRKRNVFRSLFPGSNCCSKPQPKEELPK